MNTGRRSLVWMLLVSFLSALAVSLGGVFYTGWSNRENNRQWCDLLSTLDTAYSSSPPQTELGRKVANSIHELNARFSCE